MKRTRSSNQKPTNKKLKLECKLSDIETVANMLTSGKYENIIVLTGAGISTSAGISDYRGEKSKIQTIAQEFDLNGPEDVFDIIQFKQNPLPLYCALNHLFFEDYRPTVAHQFIKQLADKNMLLRCYTQNIDGLEFKTGLNKNMVVQMHGSCETFSCIYCDEEYSFGQVKMKMNRAITDETTTNEAIVKQSVNKKPTSEKSIQTIQVPSCDDCIFGHRSLRPNIVMYGEALNDQVLECLDGDLTKCDLLLVMGTSLSVQPASSIPTSLKSGVPRILINGNKISSWKQGDIFIEGDIDSSVQKILDLMVVD